MKLNNGFQDRNTMIRELLNNGITEDEFIERFDEIMGFTGFKMFNPYNSVTGDLASLKRTEMPVVLERIYRMNTTKNKWANVKNISDKLRVFLKLKGEEI
jgi:hypothetical protein